MALRAVSLCTGVGMLDHGLDAALRLCGEELEPLLYVEREAFCAANLVWQMEEGFLAQAPIWSDVNTVTKDTVYLGLAKVDILFGGIPCQPHSQAGKRLRADDPRDLWPATRRAIEVYEPELVFIENVSAFVTGPDDGMAIVVRELEGMGYAVEGGLFSSAEVGASHIRERAFVLAYASRDGDTGNSIFWSTGRFGSRRRIRQTVPKLAHRQRLGLQWNGRATPTPEEKHGRGATKNSYRDSGCSEELAYGGDDGCEGLGVEKSRDERGARGDELDGCAEGVADRSGPRLQGRQREHPGKLPFGQDGRELPRYAPPQNSPLWELVADSRPDWLPAARREAIESQFRGMADGLASRPHRLRAIGNGVDPMVAGLAFLTLASCLDII